ncbi:hypothetical protein QBC36DRAFT_358104 [Triangularia setosa]|uniref:Uncharacterized protein n=1 Tax=Triangularia setosa TaxID=2587417 RepID=A0AAN6W310_9PEZI|nr:hypothetical protein QBC36DRAFT_358104 [Podospora setosa]
MNSQNPTPTRNARASDSSPTLSLASQSPISTSEYQGKQEEDILEDVLKKWSNTPTRKSLPFLNNLYKVGRLYDNIVRSRSHGREKQFDAYEKTHSHLENIIKSTPQGPKQQLAREAIGNTLARPDLTRLKLKSRDAHPLSSIPGLKKATVVPNSLEPIAPGSKASEVTPWSRPTPIPSRERTGDRAVKMSETLDGDGSPKTAAATPETPPGASTDSNGSSPQPPSAPLSRPIPILIKDTQEQALLPPLDLPLPPMRPISPNGAEDQERYEQFRPIYTQSYVNGVIEALKHAHSTIAKLSQEKREAESRLGALEEKQKMWHTLVHGKGCGCEEYRWWKEVEEVLIDRKGDEDEDTWDMISVA